MVVSSPEDAHLQYRKKRVGKACDSCRLKKTKCDGKSPCSRCLADNKLCVFTEKKKIKEKPLSTGYVELLETRVDLLTKSLVKVVTMAEPHLPMLQQILEKARLETVKLEPVDSDHSSSPQEHVPINEVVQFLINNLNLLEGDSDKETQGTEASQTVCQESHSILSPKPENHGLENVLGKNIHSPVTNSANEPTPFSDHVHKDAPKETIAVKQENTDEVEHMKSPTKQSCHPESCNSGLCHSNGFPNNHGIQSPSTSSSGHSSRSKSFESFQGVTGDNDSFILDRLSAYENGINFGGFLNSPPSDHPYSGYASTDQTEPFSTRSNSIFLNNDSTAGTSPSSISSLPGKLESQNIDDLLRIRRSHSTKGQVSSAFVRRKNSGHVHKPSVVSHSPQMGGTNINSAIENRFNTQNYAPNHAPNHPEYFVGSPTTEHGAMSTQFDFENDLMLSEPPSKVLADRIPLFLENEDFAMNNPFFSSIA